MAYTINDVLTLARAGFTAAQIAAMTAAPAAPTVPAPAPAAAPAVPAPAPAVPAPAPAAAPAVPAPAPAAPAVPAPAPADPLEQILTQLRINALNAAQQPPTQSVDDILAEIINPPAGK